jgi:hypothetical protein
MKNITGFAAAKLRSKRLLAIIAIAAAIGFTMAACDIDAGSKDKSASVSVEATANAQGKISFNYYLCDKDDVKSCKITTDLPEPNDSFNLNFGEYEEISGLDPGKKVKVKVTVSSGKVDASVDYGDASYVGIQTYKY